MNTSMANNTCVLVRPIRCLLWPPQRVVGIVRIGAASLLPVSTKVNRNMMDEKICLDGMSRLSMENQ
ncbi:hypothetical protein D3C78_1768840 [compost metagenome]